jgi:hypothetical protein
VAIEWEAVTTVAVTFVLEEEDMIRAYENEHNILFREPEGYIPFG